jgi:starch synthase (maltosyl-transferring)
MASVPIAFVATELAVGGAERCLATVAAGLDRSLFEPIVYSIAPPPSEEKSSLVKSLAAAGVPTRFVGAARSRQLPFAVQKLAAMLREQSPRLVQTFLFHANVAGALAVKRKERAALVAGARVAEPRPWRLRWERWATRRATKMVCVSQAVADFYRERVGFSRERLVVIPNGVDVEALIATAPANLEEFGIPAGAPTIVAVGRLERQKGFDWLLAQAETFLAALADHHLLIVGEGRERLRLSAIAKSHALLSQRVHFAGWRSDVAAILKSCRLLVMSSRYEGMPNALLEAMAIGLPVVATRAEGVVELLGSLSNEQSVAAGDGSGFCASIERVVRDAGLAGEWGRQNQLRARCQFSTKVMIERYAALYQKLVEGGSSSAQKS